VYLVTSPKRPVSRLVTIVEAALEGGASIVQLRDKNVYTPEERAEAARGIRVLCDRHAVPFLVNDDPGLARRFRADGVHVGRHDASPRIARLVMGPRAIIGVTVYGKPGEEEAAAAAGANYLAVGPFFPSPSKPDEPVLPLSVFDEVVRRSRLPVFAIGGISAANTGLFAEHGAAGIAVISAIMDADDPRAATEAIRTAFSAGRVSDPPRARTHRKRAREESSPERTHQQTVK
jgi:thiamine-phosphate diphosphorylase